MKHLHDIWEWLKEWGAEIRFSAEVTGVATFIWPEALHAFFVVSSGLALLIITHFTKRWLKKNYPY